MNLLELRMNYSAFIKLRDFVKINDISAEIKDYVKKEFWTEASEFIEYCQ